MTDAAVTWRQTWRRLRRDAHRLRRHRRAQFGYAPVTWFLDPAWQCVLLHRLSHVTWAKGHKKTGRLFMQLNSLLTGADIQPGSAVGGGLLIPSPCGVNLSGRVGENFTALALAGVGGSVRDHDIGAGLGLPVVGDNVTAAQFTGIQGSIRLGDGVVVEAGAGAVVSLGDGARMTLAVEPQCGLPPSPPPRRCDPPSRCGHSDWQCTRAGFAADIDRYREAVALHAPNGRSGSRLGAVLSNSLLALLAYRVSHWLLLNRHRRLAMLLCQVNLLLHKLTIPPEACLEGGVLMPHLAGTLVCGSAGRGLTLYATSLCAPSGGAFGSAPEEMPRLGGAVMIGGHSGIIGPVAVGSGVILGPKVQLTESVAAGMRAWSSMARGSVRHEGAADAAPPAAAPRTALRPHSTWRETRHRMRRDRERWLRSAAPGAPHLPHFPALTCVRLFRLSHYCFAAGWRRPARWLWLANVYLTGADISLDCEIGGGLFLPHPAGVSLRCRAGADLTLLAASGIGTSLDADGLPRDLGEAPQLGDGVHLAHHSGIYGPVTIGHGAHVTPGCIVTRSVADGATLVPRSLKFRRRAPAEAPDLKRSRADASATMGDAS